MPLTRRAFGLSFAALALGATPAFAQFDAMAFDDAESAIMSAGKTAARVAALRRVPGVSVTNMNFRTWAGVPFEFDRSPQQLGITADRHAADIARLRAALRRNPVTAAALAKHGVPLSRVVGVRVFTNGWLRVYFM